MKKIQNITGLIFIFVGLGFMAFNSYKDFQNKQIKNFDDKIEVLQKQISSLQGQVSEITNQPNTAVPSVKELNNRENLRAQSQDQLLTEAVSKTTPAVVSIVISKDVPKLEVVYVNPFGDDPFFKDFGVQVPQYKQVGTEKQKVGAGTGFLVKSNGFIVTNRHVVSDMQADYTVLLADGKQMPAKVVYRDPKYDLAIVKIEGSNYSSVNLGDSDSIKLGQTVIAIGNALGEYNNSVSTGIISGLNRTIDAQDGSGTLEALTGVIQTDAAVNPGNSGGPLLTLDGKIIGINVATVVGSNNISFSIPINMVKQIIDSVIR